MKAVCWYGTRDVRVESVPEPKILNGHDAIVKITLTALCGADLHLYNGRVPGLEKGEILGHEFMGEVVEVGSGVRKLKQGDRVVVPFTIACGECFFCRRGQWSLCENSNPNAARAEEMYGDAGAGLFGSSCLFGGFAGGQAQYARVPFADVGPLRVDDGLADEQVLLLADTFPTAYMAVENCNLQPGDTVAVWGCGPVGQLAIRSAWLLGAGRVIALDHVPERLEMARGQGKAEVLPGHAGSTVEKLKYVTGGRGPDACIDAVGMEGDGAQVLCQAVEACCKGGTVSIAGAYTGWIDHFPMGAAFAKGLTLKMGQANVPKYMGLLLDRIRRGEIDPSYVVTHRMRLDDAPRAYRMFNEKRDHCVKVVLTP